MDPETKAQALDLFRVQYSEASEVADRGPDEIVYDKTLPDFFALDYRASRVNFHIHQKRAHALARLIDLEYADHRPDLRIGICGGGIGGLTCFLALQAYGFENTKLFEAGRLLLGLQRGCHHRHSHPSYNDWPQADIHRMTTDLPFMNWSAGTAHDVAERMLDDDLVTSVTEGDLKSRIEENSPVEEIKRVTEGKRTVWQIEIKSKDNRVASRWDTVDVVIYALGFGRERETEFSRAENYWWDDNLENYLREWHHYTNHKMIVCGLGDGGLIDAIRIGSAPARDDMIGPRLIAAARDPIYREPAGAPDFSKTADARSDFETGFVDVCKPEGTRYDDVFDSFCREVANILNCDDDAPEAALRDQIVRLKERQKDFGDAVQLIGNTEFTLRPNMSPINAFLFAALMVDRNRTRSTDVQYRQGRFEKSDDDPAQIACTDDKGPDSYQIHKHLAFLRLGPEDQMFQIVRELNGARRKPRIDDDTLVSRVDAFTCDLRHRMLNGLRLLRDGEQADQPEIFAREHRVRCIQRFVRQHLGEGALATLCRCPDNGYWVEIVADLDVGGAAPGPDAAANREAMLRLGGFDRRLFGMPVAYRDPTPGRPRFSGSAWQAAS